MLSKGTIQQINKLLKTDSQLKHIKKLLERRRKHLQKTLKKVKKGLVKDLKNKRGYG